VDPDLGFSLFASRTLLVFKKISINKQKLKQEKQHNIHPPFKQITLIHIQIHML